MSLRKDEEVKGIAEHWEELIQEASLTSSELPFESECFFRNDLQKPEL